MHRRRCAETVFVFAVSFPSGGILQLRRPLSVRKLEIIHNEKEKEKTKPTGPRAERAGPKQTCACRDPHARTKPPMQGAHPKHTQSHRDEST